MSSPQNIVIVDDDRTNAILLEEYLRENGFEADVAYTAQDGLKKIIELKPGLVVLDLYLPDMMGSDVCSQLRMNDITKDIPVIICTAHNVSHAEKMKGFRAGVDDYLIRPFELSELLARIKAVLRRAEKKPAYEPPQVTPVAPVTAPKPVEALPFIKRALEILRRPSEAMKNINIGTDFLLAVTLVLGTPVIASLSKLTGSGGFDSWIGVLSLGLVVDFVMWFGIAGLLHLVVPFEGINLSMKKALTLAGLGWAPRFLGSVMAALYGVVVTATGWMGEPGDFSAGIDLIPGLASSEIARVLSHVGLFDVWSAAITLLGFWALRDTNERRWNVAATAIGISCLIFGAFTHY